MAAVSVAPSETHSDDGVGDGSSAPPLLSFGCVHAHPESRRLLVSRGSTRRVEKLPVSFRAPTAESGRPSN